MVTVFNPTETLKRPSAVLLFKTWFFPYPGAPSSPSGLVCSFSCGFVGARTSEWGLVLERTRECFSAYSALLEPVHKTGGMKGIKDQFIIEAEGVKGRSSD